ncbi:hypothetical protein D3C85_1729920 [compost metagenome]
MTAEEEGNSKFDRKRYDQFKLQLDYLLSRQDVDPSAQPIANAVIQAMDGLGSESSNDEFELSIERLESRLKSFGYQR